MPKHKTTKRAAKVLCTWNDYEMMVTSAVACGGWGRRCTGWVQWCSSCEVLPVTLAAPRGTEEETMHVVWKPVFCPRFRFFSKVHDNFGEKSGFDATMDDNSQLEYNLEKNEHWAKWDMKWWIYYSLIEQTILHFNTNTLSYSMREMELTLHTYMLSLLLQTHRNRDAMALPPLSLHQPSKKGGCVGWQTGNNIP